MPETTTPSSPPAADAPASTAPPAPSAVPTLVAPMAAPDALAPPIDEAAAARLRELEAILHISNMVGSVMEIDDILRVIVDTTSVLMDAPICSIYLFDGAEGERDLVLRASHGLNPAVVGKARLKPGEGLPGWVARHGQIVALKNAPADPRYSPISSAEEAECLGYLCAPLYIQTELVGVMTARKRGEYEFSPAEITIFETVCKQVAIVLEKSRLYEQKIDVERLAAIGLSLSEISHYIKNVLQAIQGGAYFLDSGLSRNDLDRARQGWTTLKRANSKIGYLVENMLNYSRTTNPIIEPVSLGGLIFQVLESCEETAKRRNITLVPEVEPDLPEIQADFEGLHNALLNLVTNAFDAMERKNGGKATVRLARNAADHTLDLSVTDEGCGIEPEQMKKLFHLFYSTKGRHGTGIGLAVTKKIVEETGGRITVESTPGVGSTFTMRFPDPAAKTVLS